MKTIQEIQQQLAELTNEVNQLANQEVKAFTFTEDEMRQFVKDLYNEFYIHLEKTLDDITYDDEIVDLSMYNNRIEIEVQADEIRRQITSEMDISMEDDDIDATVYSIINKNIAE